MDIKQIAKKWLPPILVDWYKSVKYGSLSNSYFWEGIYQNFHDVPVVGSGFDSEIWIRATSNYTYSFLNDKSLRSSGDLSLLPFLVSLVSNDIEQINILDIGGGMGSGYIQLNRSLPDNHKIQYYIVEGQKVCEAGSKMFYSDSHIKFYNTLPKDLPNIHIIYIRSALQYIENYKGLLGQLAGYHPQHFLFVDLVAGKNPSYVTAQKNVQGSVIPYWFFNLNEILDLMASFGYTLVFHGMQERIIDQSNFPVSYRLGRACNLLFVRESNTYE